MKTVDFSNHFQRLDPFRGVLAKEAAVELKTKLEDLLNFMLAERKQKFFGSYSQELGVESTQTYPSNFEARAKRG